MRHLPEARIGRYAAVGDGFSGATDSLAEARHGVQKNRSGAVYQRLDACGEDHEVGSKPDDCYACLAEQTDAFARGFLALWREMGIQDADDWLVSLRERAEARR